MSALDLSPCLGVPLGRMRADTIEVLGSESKTSFETVSRQYNTHPGNKGHTVLRRTGESILCSIERHCTCLTSVHDTASSSSL